MTNQANALLVYTTGAIPNSGLTIDGAGNLLTESQFDQTFAEAVVRFLASELAMPIGGRPDFAKQKLVEAGQLITSDSGKDS